MNLLQNVAKCRKRIVLSQLRQSSTSLNFRESVNACKIEARKMILIENVNNNNSKSNSKKFVDKEALENRFQCQLDSVWSWNYQRRNYALIKLTSQAEVEKFQRNCAFSPHAFPIKSRMIQGTFDISTKEDSSTFQHFDFSPATMRRVINCNELKKNFDSKQVIEHFARLYSLSELDSHMRYFLLTQLEDILCCGVFSDFQIYPFGSSLAGLGDTSSDLDVALLKCANTSLDHHTRFCQPELKSERDQTQQSLSLIADVARHFLPNFSQINRILRARVPIVKMQFDAAPIQLDVSIELSEENGHHGFIMANYIAYCTKGDPNIKQFFVLLKLWAKQHGIVKSIAGTWFTNFQIVTLAIYFLQSKGILSSMENFEERTKLDDSHVSVPDVQQLIYEFLEFIVSFDFEKNALSILQSKNFPKPDYAPLYIENPIERDLNICKNINGVEFKKLLLTAYNSLDAMHNPQFHVVDLLDVEYFKKLEAQSQS